MISSIRQSYNASFTQEKYQAFCKEMENAYPGALDFRLAETPVFVPKSFTEKMLNACEAIIDVIKQPDFKEMTDRAIPAALKVPNENENPQCLVFDFGVCKNEEGELEPQLIEMQGFPTLFGYQVLLDDVFRKHFSVPENFSMYLGGFDRESYLELLKEWTLGGHDPKHVILLEIFPEKQKTRVDFYATETYTGIRPTCLTELIKEGKKLYYQNGDEKTEIKRIYNRIIFDDLQQQSAAVQEKRKILMEELDVEWAPHPAWFYRISKFTMPFIKHPYVPTTRFLNEMEEIPTDLENYVLKPLFSFAGQGVVIDVTPADIDNIKDPENWILQQKVNYADVIETPDIPAKAEIRLFYFWPEGEDRPKVTCNLSRLSKGKMIGVRYNKDKEWVGGSHCYFEK